MTTTTDIAQQDNSELTLLPPARPLANDAVDQLMRHAEAMQAAHRLASVMCSTQMVPAIYRGKPDDGAAAMLYGAELGLNPIQSLQNIFPVHGMPSMYARTMAALVKRHGYRLSVEVSTDEEVTVLGVAPDGQSERSTWTIERATKAGYVPTVDERTNKFKTNSNGKLIGNEKYLTQPREMLYAKAVAEICRHLAPDVLLGIAYTYEELQAEHGDDSPRRVVSTTRQATVVDDLRAQLAGSKSTSEPPAQDMAPADPEAEVPAEQPPAESEQPTPETDADASPPKAVTNRKMHALFRDAGLGDNRRTERLTVVSKIISRPITTGNEMSEAEAVHVINTLQELKDTDVLRDSIEGLLAEAAATDQNQES